MSTCSTFSSVGPLWPPVRAYLGIAKTVELMRGPTVKIVVASKNDSVEVQEKWSYSIPKALLRRYTGYFRGASHPVFKESEDLCVHITDTDPHIFELFVQWIIGGKFEDKDDLSNHMKVRDCAKAWVLGDYLVAPGFKNYAMLYLYNIYHPKDRSEPKSGIGPASIMYCCNNTPPDSPLRKLFLHVLVTFWDRQSVVHYDEKLRKQWQEVWAEHPDFSEGLIYHLHSGRKNSAMISAFACYTDRGGKRDRPGSDLEAEEVEDDMK